MDGDGYRGKDTRPHTELSGSVHVYCLTQLENENDLYGTSCSIMLDVAQAVQS
jgi:hypothetical protein